MSAFGGVMNFLSGGQYGKAEESLASSVDAAAKGFAGSVDALKNLPVWDPAKVQLELQRAVELGKITPQQAQNFLLQQSAQAGVEASPEVLQQQRDSLKYFQDLAKLGGLNATDRAQLEQLQTAQDTNERGNREAIMVNQAQRGLLGSGNELAAKLMGEQASADRKSAAGSQIASLAQQRALQAMTQAGSLSSSMRGQDVSEQTQKAQAADAIAKFNAAMQSQTNLTNTAANNRAQEQQLAQAYAIQAQNLEQQRQEQIAAANSYQQGYNNQLNQANQLSNSYIQQANQLSNAYRQSAASQYASGDASRQAITGAISSLVGAYTGGAGGALSSGGSTASSSAGTGAAGMNGGSGVSLGSGAGGISGGNYSWYSDENLKKEEKTLSEDEISELLNGLTGYSYKYKGSNEPSVGVMAQDLEKTPLKDNVVETPKGKMVVNDGTMQSAVLAALANINKRVNQLEGGDN